MKNNYMQYQLIRCLLVILYEFIIKAFSINC